MNAQFYRLYVPMLDRIQQVWRKNFRFLASTIRQFSKEEFSYYVHIVSNKQKQVDAKTYDLHLVTNKIVLAPDFIFHLW